ncbi:MAG TPA: ferredoxin--NADP reductase [Candidatus Limnocylindrales bacterium]|nr:ferredoxin--NADP reductase [Candidatus Limnocylindrales bacterium]
MSPNEPSSSGDDAAKARHHYHDLRVRRIVRETADASSIVFEIPPKLRDLFAYQAGQFLTLQLPYQGRTLYRCYSLASCPVTETEHKVTVKRVADGRISNWINDNLKEGDVVKVLPPGGMFVLGPRDVDLVLLAGGSGITPVISIIKTALATTRRSLRLIYANRDEDCIIFRGELDDLAARNPDRLQVIHRLDVRDGFIDDAAVRRYIADRIGAEFYICGPGPFMDTVEKTLVAAGVAPEFIHIERFSSLEDEGEVAGEGIAERPVQVFLDGARTTVGVREGETVLHACKRQGMEPPFSCESGFCGCCMARLKKGSVHMLHNDFLSAGEIGEGWILTCQSVPDTDDCEVEYPD